jgi:hypothetical protein
MNTLTLHTFTLHIPFFGTYRVEKQAAPAPRKPLFWNAEAFRNDRYYFDTYVDDRGIRDFSGLVQENYRR